MSRMFRRRGANALEFALTLPVFLLFFLGIMDWGWFLFNRAMLMDATAQGCALGAKVHPRSGKTPEGVSKAAIIGGIKRLGYDCKGSGLSDCKVLTQEVFGNVTVGEHETIMCQANTIYEPITGYVMIPRYVKTTAEYRLEFQN